MADLKNLQQAASKAARKNQSPDPAPRDASSPVKQDSRAGKIAITFHLPADFKRSLRLIQAYRGTGCTFEQLAAEAFNDLFSKHNVPTVNSTNS